MRLRRVCAYPPFTFHGCTIRWELCRRWTRKTTISARSTSPTASCVARYPAIQAFLLRKFGRPRPIAKERRPTTAEAN